ncbi:MAG: DNA-3-methyladenine glycosylase family protein [Candidatus Saccharimonadales bacterium]
MATPANLRIAEAYLIRHDPVLAAVIDREGACTLAPHREYYRALVDSIIGQQLSVKAAARIKQRFRELFGGKFPAPEEILQKSPEALRAVGLSLAKAKYVRDLAQHIIDGKIRFDKLETQTNQQIIAKLTDVKGIGEWTADMFLILCVGRLDVLPTGDLGIKNGVKKLYNLKSASTLTQITQIAEQNNWHPYESVASYYVWRSLNNSPS